MTFKQFVSKNESGRVFVDITAEAERTYIFSSGFKLVIGEPIALHISKSGHYVVGTDGVVSFMPYGPNGFVALQFVNLANKPTMSF
jgi:hypothetical protein